MLPFKGLTQAIYKTYLMTPAKRIFDMNLQL